MIIIRYLKYVNPRFISGHYVYTILFFILKLLNKLAQRFQSEHEVEPFLQHFGKVFFQIPKSVTPPPPHFAYGFHITNINLLVTFYLMPVLLFCMILTM